MDVKAYKTAILNKEFDAINDSLSPEQRDSDSRSESESSTESNTIPLYQDAGKYINDSFPTEDSEESATNYENPHEDGVFTHPLVLAAIELLQERGAEFYADCLELLERCEADLFLTNKSFTNAIITHTPSPEDPNAYLNFLREIKNLNHECSWDILYYHAIESDEDKIAILLEVAPPNFDWVDPTDTSGLFDCSTILELACFNIDDPRIAVLIDYFIDAHRDDRGHVYREIVQACTNLLIFDRTEYYKNPTPAHEAFYNNCLSVINRIDANHFFNEDKIELIEFNRQVILSRSGSDVASVKAFLEAIKNLNQPREWDYLYWHAFGNNLEMLPILYEIAAPDFNYKVGYEGVEFSAVFSLACSNAEHPIAAQIIQLARETHKADWHALYAAAICEDPQKIQTLLELESPPFTADGGLLVLAAEKLEATYRQEYSRHNKFSRQDKVPKKEIKALKNLISILLSNTMDYTEAQRLNIRLSAETLYRLNTLDNVPKIAPWSKICRLLADIYQLAESYESIKQKILELPIDEQALFLPEQINAYYQAIHRKIIQQVNENEVTDPDLSILITRLQEATYISSAVWTVITNLLKMGGLSEWPLKRRSSLPHSVIITEGPSTYITDDDPEITGWYLLPEGELDKIGYQLMTTILYQAKRHEWNSLVCLVDRHLLAKISNNRYPLKLSALTLQQKVEEIETATGSYYGEYPSDDSDEEEITKYEQNPLITQYYIENMAKTISDYGQTSKLLTEAKLEKNKKLKKPRQVGYGISELAEIHHPKPIPADYHHALSRLNSLVLRGELDEESYARIGKKFFVAQYRGYHYNTESWSASTRRTHRRQDERAKPIYSQAVERSENPADRAILLDHQLQSLRYTGSYHDKEVSFAYDSVGDALQSVYCHDYAKYHSMLAKLSEKRKQGALLTSPLEVGLSFAENAFNPFVSTGDRPRHALRYAYGSKSYPDSKKPFRLRPRWRRDGRAERPYSGKVYTLLFTPLDYFKLNPNQITALNHEKRLSLPATIVSERETAFTAAIPAGKIIDQHIAKYPSFHHKTYSNLMLQKYGLNETMYDRLRLRIAPEASDPSDPPHSQESKDLKYQLAEHLCAYHEASLIEGARIAAERRGGLLIYRDPTTGTFTFVSPPDLERPINNDSEEAVAASARLETQSKKIEARKRPRSAAEGPTSPDEGGWLIQLLKTQQVLLGQSLNDILPRLSLRETSDIQGAYRTELEGELPADYFAQWKNPPPAYVAQVFRQTLGKLQNVANVCQIAIKLKSFLFNEDINLTPTETAAEVAEPAIETIELIYLGGASFFGLLAKSKAPTKSFAEVMGLEQVNLSKEESDEESQGPAVKRSRITEAPRSTLFSPSMPSEHAAPTPTGESNLSTKATTQSNLLSWLGRPKK